MSKDYLFTFEWIHGNRCVNDYIIEWLKQHNITFRYNQFFSLVADVYRTNKFLKFGYEKVTGNTYGVFIAN